MNALEARLRSATRATAEEIAPDSIPPLDLSGRGLPKATGPERGDPRHGPGRWARVLIPLAAAASVIAVLASAAVITSGPHDERAAGGSPGGPAGVPSGSVRHVSFRIVPFPASPFRSLVFRHVGPGPIANDMDCVTASVCYAWGSGNHGHGAERTADGGATWWPLAALPDHQYPASMLTGGLSCPTTEVCFGATGGLRLAVTADGGGHWRTESLPELPGNSRASVDQVSCVTAEKCVVHVLIGDGHGMSTVGTYFFTVDGGKAWTQPSSIPLFDRSAPGQWFLRCDPDGRCIGLAPTGSTPKIRMAALRSADGGRTWTATSTVLAAAASTLMMSCGDALHCMVVSDASSGATRIATTSDGGVTWQATTSRGWPDTATSLSCPTARVCYVAATDFAAGVGASTDGYSHPVIEATNDLGSTWAAISVPTASRSPLAIVDHLSCPAAAGCIATAETAKQFSTGSHAGQETILSTFARAGN